MFLYHLMEEFFRKFGDFCHDSEGLSKEYSE